MNEFKCRSGKCKTIKEGMKKAEIALKKAIKLHRVNMKTKKTKKPEIPKELYYKTGVVVWITRSGAVNCSYFDYDNDFNSLFDSLLIANEYFRGCGFCTFIDENTDEFTLYPALKEWLNRADQGQLYIVENQSG